MLIRRLCTCSFIHYNGKDWCSGRNCNGYIQHLRAISVTYLHIFFSLALQPQWALASSDSWSFLQTVGLLGRVISPSQGLYLNTRQHKHRINIYTRQTFMPWVEFKPTIPASERTKTVHALDRSASVTGICIYTRIYYSKYLYFINFISSEK
jgi:hypothetical protein